MGVTGAIFKGLTFDGEDSKDYGVYITGQAVYNSPERDVEMISIPGRDGAFALDRGRFSNIEVIYPAGLFGVDEADFAQAIADFRNMLGSRVGYCRLEDDYNPGEYREAVFKAGLEVTPASLDSGQFDIVFECKPQRWLTSGEDAVAVTSGGTITNPTLFDARPMLQVWGYGNIDLGGQDISIANALVGNIIISNGGNDGNTDSTRYKLTPDYTQVNSGDAVTVDSSTMMYRLTSTSTRNLAVSNVSLSWVTGSGTVSFLYQYPGYLFVNLVATPVPCNYGTANASIFEANITATVTGTSGGTKTGIYNITITGAYSAAGVLSYTGTFTKASGDTIFDGYAKPSANWGIVTANSTKTATGSPLYFDLDIGEAYTIEGGVPVSVNNAVTIPAVLPTLKPGSNTITFDNTITQFKVVPRWWRL